MIRKFLSTPCAHLPHFFKGLNILGLGEPICSIIATCLHYFCVRLFYYRSIGNPIFRYLDSAEKWDEDCLFSTFIIKKVYDNLGFVGVPNYLGFG